MYDSLWVKVLEARMVKEERKVVQPDWIFVTLSTPFVCVC